MRDKRREAFYKVVLIIILPILTLMSICRVGKTEGPSMEPTYHSGDYFLLFKFPQSFSVGDIVAIDHPTLGTLLKRVEYVEGDYLYLLGDNRDWSWDSRDFGLLPADQVRGRILFPRSRYSPTGLMPNGEL